VARKFLVVLALVVLWVGQAAAQTDQVFNIAGSLAPNGLALAPDGSFWFAEVAANAPFSSGIANLARIASDGSITQYTIPVPVDSFSTPVVASTIALGPDGNMWLPLRGFVARVTPDGTVTKFPTTTAGYEPGRIVAGSDGAMWFPETPSSGSAVIAKVTMAGVVTEYPLPANSGPAQITAGPDGNIWFVDAGLGSIAKITTSGVVTEYRLSALDSFAIGIAAGADGKLWFTIPSDDVIGSITTDGTIAQYHVQSGTSPREMAAGSGNTLLIADGDDTIGVFDVSTATLSKYAVPVLTGPIGGTALGPNGTVWYTNVSDYQIGWFTVPTAGPLVAAVLPSSRTVTIGNTATVFATIINAGSQSATGCTVAPVTSVPVTFSYQTTNPATNAVSGTANTPVTIAAGAAQTFVLSLTPTAAYGPDFVAFGFHCANAGYAAVTASVNTMILGGVGGPTADIVAIAVTPSGDGTLDIPGSTGSAAFAVATTNLGISGSVIVSPFTVDSEGLPLTLTLCQTDPVSGQCISAISPSLTTTIASGATPTFAIFAQASGAIPFSPAKARILVSFESGVGTGLTSVAVRTQ